MKFKRFAKSTTGVSARTSVSTPDLPARPQSIGEWIGVIFVLAMFALTGAVGCLTILAGVRQLLSGEASIPKALVLIAVGLVFAAIGLGYFYFRYVKKPLWDAEQARLEARYPGQPWMQRKDWASRRVTHSNLGVTALLWVWNIGWWGALAFIGTVNRDKIRVALDESWWTYFLLGAFVFCGLIALRFALAATWAHVRYGRTTLRLDTLPAYIGDRFRGTVEARLRARPVEPLRAALICEQLKWIRIRTGGKTTSRLDVRELARVEREIPASLVMVSRTGARIPVEIDVPPASREYSLDSEGNGVRWTLHVDAPDSKQPFSCSFEIPVYARRA
ncbi:hypothetical protein [Hyphomicrobium sp. DMF-1]|jgi:hypothetical protein|uniref:hypothetical protein n=1 Tax=Hyphomicrobium sp. DMF-1 TaxID=3019544 RepID=UPI0022EBE6E1|nr:hypothetical protein [Hyphomicrobium sp. DMF-1]WBT37862.1 hypothetical protein PE058_19730 [Hyphomicrobium sp. DMF-1]